MASAVTLRNPDPFPASVIADIQAHAIAAYPEEAVGFVMPEGYVPAKNVHPDPTNHFSVDPVAVALASERALAFVHSHPDGQPTPSYQDQVAQIADGRTWGIVPVMKVYNDETPAVVAGHVTWWGDDLPVAPLEGRKFLWGVFHCWSLYRDWMRLEHGVLLPNFACDPDFVEAGEDVFLKNCQAAGLRNLGKIPMHDLRRSDMLVGKIRGRFPNHCAVYTGGDYMLHHAPASLSGPTSLLRWWPYIDTVFRYDGLEKTPPLR
jgi:proteasome lid subunit RPN8/RPN11